MTSPKSIRLMVRVTPEFKERLDRAVEQVPGGRADVMRWALERYVAELERNGASEPHKPHEPLTPRNDPV